MTFEILSSPRSRRILAILAILAIGVALSAGAVAEARPLARSDAASSIASGASGAPIASGASTAEAVLVQKMPVSTIAPQDAAPGSAVAAQPQEKAPEATSTEGAEDQAEQNESWKPAIAKTVNFLLLVGILVYYLRSPIAGYLQRRRDTIRKDLTDAATLRSTAEAQLTDVRAKLAQLPGELEALKRRGQDELAAEAVRMKDATAREREKLIDRTHREIETQSRVARRALVDHTAELAMKLARERVERDITPADQDRLIDRYASGVGA